MKNYLSPFGKNRFNYLLYGALFGCCFPVIAYFILDKPNVLFGIILTAPFFLGIFAFYAGVKQDNIEDEVLKRTKELNEAKIQLENALQVKSRFLATMSHEIRTPMNAVLSCVTLLRSNVKLPENVELLNTISQSGETLLTLINDILDLSKMEAGKLGFEERPFNIVNATKHTFELYLGKAEGKTLNLNIKDYENFPTYVNGDIVRYKQVLSNLIDNALKFTRDIVEVKIRYQKLDASKYKFIVDIIDNGIGISKQNQKRLFSDFEQVDHSTTRNYGGTGLGLAISKKLVERMNGNISVDSEEGKGATFSFSIVLEHLENFLEQDKNEVFKFDGLLAEQFPLKILVAEDNMVNQLVIKKMMKKVGYEVDIANNGEEAIKLYEKIKPDLIFMDMSMPIMDGIQATEKIRERFGSQVEIYALTANAFEEDKKNCLKAGMNGFLTKPLRMEKITDVVIQVSKNKQMKRSA